ncbi:MAG TPA: hypothetical protein VG899_16115 [Mycobacteriales bacterium]|nr:hypothetical protein [Mycobacteriales bacterium]
MSDTSGAAASRQSGPWLVARGGLSVAVVAAGVVVAVTRGSSPITSAATILRDPRDATVRTASGATHVGSDGESITDGEVVMTGPHGVADLDTRGRNVLLSGDAALEVVDGEHQQLKTGTAVVDARNGAGLLLDLTGDTVSVPQGSATEAARGVSVRVGSLVGPASVTSSNGRRLSIPRLYQALLSGDALPADVAPLHLSDSNDEVEVIPHVVADDLSLKSLARGIDTTGRSTARVIEASWSGIRQPVPDSHTRSERVLPVLIADATHGGQLQQRYDDAVDWRAEGGSWGVVLHLLDGTAATVESTLASLQKAAQPAGQVGTVVTVGATTVPTGPTAIATPPVIGGKTTFPTAPVSSQSPPPATTPPTQIPPNLLGGLIETLQSVISGVLNLLPHDSTAPTDTTTPTTPKGSTATTSTVKGSPDTTVVRTGKPATPTPSPSATPDGLLGDLLGGLLGQH